MKNAAHQYEDKLLEFAYGELSQHEAEAVDAHVRGCANCAEALAEIRSVRATMAALPAEPAPDAGLDSLLAYAAQAAERNAAAAKPSVSIWKRFLTPMVSLMALATVGVIAWRANQEFDTSPASAAADGKLEAMVEKQKRKAQEQPEGAQVQQNVPADLPAAPVVAAVAPQVPEPQREEKKSVAKAEELNKAMAGKLGKGDAWGEPGTAAPAPQSVTRRASPKTKSAADELRQDFSNAALRGANEPLADDGVQGGARAKDVAPPPPPPKPAKTAPVVLSADPSAPSYGLGSGGGLSTQEAKPAPRPVEKSAKEEESRARAEVATAPTTPAPTPAPSSAPPMKKASRGSYSLAPLGSASSGYAGDDSVALDKSDALGVDNDAKFAERSRAEQRTRSLEAARVASSRGDRAEEIQLLLQTLQNGATGYEKTEALKRLCDAYEALGDTARADPYCDQLLREFPNTVAAKVVTERRNRVQRAGPSSASDAKKKAAPAEAAPAQSY